MLTKGNTKLGKIYNWSIPAIITCPGRSTFCELLCYADKGFFRMGSTRDAHKANLDTVMNDRDWPNKMVAEIRKKKIKLVRLHVAGDFFSTDYLKEWRTVVGSCPDTVFYAYTRSWALPSMLAGLQDIAACPNVHLWFSADHVMSEPPRIEGIRIAYLSRNEDDMPEYPVDLVFRETGNKKWKPAKKMGPHNSQICPYEQGIERKVKLTCETCKLCYTRRNNNVDRIGNQEASGRESGGVTGRRVYVRK